MANYSDLKRQKSLAQQGQDSSPYSPKNTAGAKAKTAKTTTAKSSSASAMPKIAAADQGYGSLTDQLGMTQADTFGDRAIPAAAASETKAPMTFADYLKAAQQLLGGSTTTTPDLSSYDTQLAAVKGSGVDADAKLAAMYSQLQGAFNAQAPGIKADYASTSKTQAANSDAATKSINQGYGAATSDLTNMLSRLGIGDAATLIANKGTTLQGDQAQANANVQQNKAATLNHTANNGAAAVTYNQGVGDAAQLAGGEARATNQENLQKQIAAILSAKQTAAASASTSGPSASDYTSLAQQLYENDLANDPTSVANQLKASTAANSINKTNSASSQATVNQRIKLYQIAVQQFPNDPDKANAAYKSLVKAQGLG